jgi:hypothetical protein
MAAGDAVGPAGLTRLVLLAILLLLLLFLAVLVLPNAKFRANSRSSRKCKLNSDLVKIKVRSTFKAKGNLYESSEE